MKKTKARVHRHVSTDGAYSWLPIDSMFVPTFRLTHVKGFARFFLIVEIILSVLIVTGTVILTVLQIAL